MSTTQEERLHRCEEVLAKVAEGYLDQRIEVCEASDALSGLEMGINFLVLDLRQAAETARAQQEELLAQQRELEAKLSMIERQSATIRDLSTPVMEVWTDVLVLPIVGVLDSQRSAEILRSLLRRIEDKQTRFAIIDITGVDVVDTKTAAHLLKVVRAASLLGTRCILTGISSAVAQTLVDIGVDLGEILTLRSLKAGLAECLRLMKET